MVYRASYLVGTYEGLKYRLYAEANPDQDDPDDFVVNVSYLYPGDQTRTQIARVDTMHSFRHFDKLFLPEQPKVEVDWEFWESVKQLNDNWLTYAEQYQKHHG